MKRDFILSNYPESKRKKETFIVKIYGCQNATWQGKIVWVEEKRVVHFRSALELIKLIDGAVNQSSLSYLETADEKVSGA